MRPSDGSGHRPKGTGAKRRALTSPERRSRELARIHILATDLGLDRGAYEDMLWTVTRADSAGKLDAAGRRAVIVHLERLKGRRASPEGTAPNSLAERPLLQKIRAQLADAGRPWGYAAALAERLAGKERLEFCSDAELGKIVAALAIDQGRRARRSRKGAPG